MKVSVYEIDEEKEDYVELYIGNRNKSINNLIHYIESEKYKVISVTCYKKDKIFNIISEDIYYIETSKEKLLIHTEKDVYESKSRLYELERVLPYKFIRISKSTIINLEKVMMYKPLINGLMEVKFINLEISYISRKYLKEVRARIKGGI